MIHTLKHVVRRRGTRVEHGAWLAVFGILSTACEMPSRQTDTNTDGITLSADQIATLSHTESLAQVKDLTVLPNGEVWVLNSIEPFFVEFAPDGHVVREYGKVGGGPTEFGAPTAFVTGDIEGAAWVFDAERHSLIEVSGHDATRHEIFLPTDESLPPTHLFGGRELIGAGLRSAHLGEDFVFALNAPDFSNGMLSFWRSIWSADLVAYNPAARSTRQLVSLAEALGSPDGAFELVGDFPPFPFWFRLWTVCRDADIRVYDRLSNRVRAFSADGSPLASDTLPTIVAGRSTKEQMARVGFGLGMLEAGGELSSRAPPQDSARIIAQLSRRVEGSPDQLEALLPRYVDLRCATDGTLWLRRYDAERADLRGGLQWVRLSPGGTLQEVTFPEGFDAFFFFADRVWGVQRDSLDVPTVAWLALPSP